MHVLITGATGHIGFNLCRALLERGHRVRASVHSLADGHKAAALRALGPLEVVELEVRQPKQFRAAADGVDLVYHLAAVYAYVVPRGQVEERVVRPSIEGAENALRAAADARVSKVVLTSSIVTLPLTARGAPPSTEAEWTQDLRVPYVRAKTQAEQRAWELAGEFNINFVTVLPGAIGGPGFSRGTPSTDVFEGIMRGTMRMGAPDANLPYVDIRDVVHAHVLAGERDCSGRFTACNDHLPSFLELIELMHRIDPRIPLTRSTIPDFMVPAAPFFDWLNGKLLGSPRVMTSELIASIRGRVWNASNERIRKELGWTQSVSLETSLHDLMQAIRDRWERLAA